MKKASLGRMLLLWGLVTAAANLIHPVTPALLQDLAMPDYMFGLLFACMSFTFFLFSPLWGVLSERFGRVPVFALCAVGYGVGQFLFMLATEPVPLVLTRLFSGIFSGGFQVAAMAYMVDMTTPRNRARYMSYFAACKSVTTAAGFLIGGVVGDYTIPAVFILQVAMLFATALLAMLLLGESVHPVLDTGAAPEPVLRAANPFRAFLQAARVMTWPFAVFLFITLLTSFATSNYDNTLNYYVRDILGFSSAYNGYIKAAFGIIGLVSNFTINVWLSRHVDGRRSQTIVLVLCGLSLFAVLLMPTVGLFLFMNIVFYTFNTIFVPIQQTLAVKNQKEADTGLVSGVFNSIYSLGMVLGSLFAGFIYLVGPQLPFVFAASAFLLGAVGSAYNAKQYKKP